MIGNIDFRVYYSVEGKIQHTRLVNKENALALYKVHSDAFLVTKEEGWWKRVLRFRMPPKLDFAEYPR